MCEQPVNPRRDAMHGVRGRRTGCADAMHGVPTAWLYAAAAIPFPFSLTNPNLPKCMRESHVANGRHEWRPYGGITPLRSRHSITPNSALKQPQFAVCSEWFYTTHAKERGFALPRNPNMSVNQLLQLAEELDGANHLAHVAVLVVVPGHDLIWRRNAAKSRGFALFVGPFFH